MTGKSLFSESPFKGLRPSLTKFAPDGKSQNGFSIRGKHGRVKLTPQNYISVSATNIRPQYSQTMIFFP